MDCPLNNVSFVLQRCAALKLRIVPVSVGFWYHLHVHFFPEYTLTFKTKKDKLPLLPSSSTANCKVGCNLLAIPRTTPGSTLTVLTISSSYLRITSTPFSFRSASCCFLQDKPYHTVSAMFAYTNSNMLPHSSWYQFKKNRNLPL